MMGYESKFQPKLFYYHAEVKDIYGINGNIPNHSVLSKAQARWGVKAFKAFLSILSGSV